MYAPRLYLAAKMPSIALKAGRCGKGAIAGLSGRGQGRISAKALGTMAKYIFRFRNLKREKDILKIACYCYILWLKMGFWENDQHDEDVEE